EINLGDHFDSIVKTAASIESSVSSIRISILLYELAQYRGDQDYVEDIFKDINEKLVEVLKIRHHIRSNRGKDYTRLMGDEERSRIKNKQARMYNVIYKTLEKLGYVHLLNNLYRSFNGKEVDEVNITQLRE